MKWMEKGKLLTLALSAVAIAVMLTAVTYSPTLYRMFCAATGYGGKTQRSIQPVASDPVDGPMVTVRFDANVAPGLDWEFRPGQTEVRVPVGVPTQVYYVARNVSDRPIVARATYNVTPDKAGVYFFKIDCFCFTNERLEPGQSAHMPLVFYVDKQFMIDRKTKDVPDITLSYTFFKQDMSPEEMASVRDLAEGSEQQKATQAQGGVADFSVDVRRR